METVGRQASASLAFIGSTRVTLPRTRHWSRPLPIRERKKKTLIKMVDRIHSRSGLSAQDAHARVQAALTSPNYRREVWVVTSGLLSKQKAIDALSQPNRPRGALQFAYYLADLRTAFNRANVALKIFTAD
jgi:hypothetical protein